MLSSVSETVPFVTETTILGFGRFQSTSFKIISYFPDSPLSVRFKETKLRAKTLLKLYGLFQEGNGHD